MWLVVYGMCDFRKLFIRSEQPYQSAISEKQL